MNDWNYTKKGAKTFFIYALTIIIIYQIAIFFAPYPDAALINNVYKLRNFIDTFALILLFPLFLPAGAIASFIPSPDWIWFGLLIPLSGVLIGAVLGLIMDLFYYSNDIYQNNQEKVTKKTVFIKISLGNRKIVISERFVNCLTLIEIILLISVIGIHNSGVMDRIIVDGDYRSYGYQDSFAISFNSELNTFSEKINDTKKTGTYVIDGNVLILHYSDGNTAEYSIYELGIRLYPLNRSKFANDEEWKKNGYIKPILA